VIVFDVHRPPSGSSSKSSQKLASQEASGVEPSTAPPSPLEVSEAGASAGASAVAPSGSARPARSDVSMSRLQPPANPPLTSPTRRGARHVRCTARAYQVASTAGERRPAEDMHRRMPRRAIWLASWRVSKSTCRTGPCRSRRRGTTARRCTGSRRHRWTTARTRAPASSCSWWATSTLRCWACPPRAA